MDISLIIIGLVVIVAALWRCDGESDALPHVRHIHRRQKGLIVIALVPFALMIVAISLFVFADKKPNSKIGKILSPNAIIVQAK